MASSSSSSQYHYPPAGKTALITGGSSGIGHASAKALALAGWNVILTGRTLSKLEAATKDIRDALDHRNEIAAQQRNERQSTATTDGAGDGGIKVAYLVSDASVESDVIETFKEIVDMFGRVDLLFANCGISPAATRTEDMELATWQNTINTNLTATFLCARQAFRIMKQQQGGRIIINGSISAHVPRPDSVAYTSTKSALTGLTKSLALDGRKYNISLTQIDIGNASSNMTSRMSTGPGVLQSDGITYKQEPVMNVDHVAREIENIAETPLEVDKLFVVIMARGMPSMVGRG